MDKIWYLQDYNNFKKKKALNKGKTREILNKWAKLLGYVWYASLDPIMELLFMRNYNE